MAVVPPEPGTEVVTIIRSYQLPRSQLPHAELPFHPSGDHESLVVADNEASNTVSVRVVDRPQ